jgi:hypothetical protein
LTIVLDHALVFIRLLHRDHVVSDLLPVSWRNAFRKRPTTDGDETRAGSVWLVKCDTVVFDMDLEN